jgi:hypothetical protein
MKARSAAGSVGGVGLRELIDPAVATVAAGPRLPAGFCTAMPKMLMLCKMMLAISKTVHMA